jgi:hypothetical protein
MNKNLFKVLLLGAIVSGLVTVIWIFSAFGIPNNMNYYLCIPACSTAVCVGLIVRFHKDEN